jgi:hypothetical protein
MRPRNCNTHQADRPKHNSGLACQGTCCNAVGCASTLLMLSPMPVLLCQLLLGARLATHRTCPFISPAKYLGQRPFQHGSVHLQHTSS